MPLHASPALGNGAADPQGSLRRDRSSFFPQAVTQPNADARSLYLSRCYFWPLSCRRLRGAPGAAGGVTVRKHLQALLLRKLTASRGPGVRQAPARTVPPLPGAPCAGPQRNPHLACSALHATRRAPSSWEVAWFWGTSSNSSPSPRW